jgi:phosphohistidine phosphatase
MDLILWRHAEAEHGLPDMERRLTPKGREQAMRVADWLRARLPPDALVLASPAQRAQQTAAALTQAFRTVAQLAPETRAQQVLDAAGWSGGSGTVVVVGHQPTLGRAAALALTGAKADWSMVPAALWWLARDGAGGEAGRKTLLRAAISPELL